MTTFNTSNNNNNNNPFMEEVLPDQLGYVQCSFCGTILLVSVPCSSLVKVVTVKCGHCTCLLSVSLVRSDPFFPLQDLLASLVDHHHHNDDEGKPQQEIRGVATGMSNAYNINGGDHGDENDEEEEEEGKETPPPVMISNEFVNKPPEKRQRAPSAYNHFIKEEIQRIKARDPSISHKDAFSTAAKNWAHFPRFQHKQQGKGNERGSCSCSMTSLGNGKTERHTD